MLKAQIACYISFITNLESHMTSTKRTLIVVFLIIALGLLGYFVYTNYPSTEMLAAAAHCNDQNVPQEKIASDYEWVDANLKQLYNDALWNKIVSDRFSCFTPYAELSEVTSYETDNSLRDEGIQTYEGRSLQDQKGNAINIFEELQDRFAPVESESEAIGFVAATKGRLAKDGEVILGHSISTTDGYLVQVTVSYRTTCPISDPSGIIYEVKKDGTITQVAAQPLTYSIGGCL